MISKIVYISRFHECLRNLGSFTLLPTLCMFSRLHFCHANTCLMVTQCGFNLLLSNDQWYWASFHMLNCYLYMFFDEGSVHIFCSFFMGLFPYWVLGVLDTSHTWGIRFLHIFSFSMVSLFHLVTVSFEEKTL